MRSGLSARGTLTRWHLPAVLLCAQLLPLSSRSQSVLDPTGNRSRDAALALHRTGAVPRCWNAFLAENPDAASAQFRLRVAVDAQGHVGQVTVRDPVPPELLECVRTQLRRAEIAPGAAVTVDTTYAFAAGTPAPVPAPTLPSAQDASARDASRDGSHDAQGTADAQDARAPGLADASADLAPHGG